MDADSTAAERRMIMRCRECPDYAKCVKESNLAIKRKTCKKAKTKYVMTNADRIRAMTDEDLADFLAYTWATSARAWQKDTGETLHWLKQRSEGE